MCLYSNASKKPPEVYLNLFHRAKNYDFLNIFNLFQSVHSFVNLLVRGIKNGHLIGRRNDLTANMAALAVYMCLAASCLLDTPRSSVWVSQVRCALVQKFTVIVWCEGAALAISTWVFLFRYLGTLAVSVLGS